MSDEEDYMSMIIEEPKQKETFTQKKLRQQREAEARAKVPSKAERRAEEASRRDAALNTSTLDPTNKGFQMMAKLGYKPGEGLGKREDTTDTTEATETTGTRTGTNTRRTEPLDLIFKEDRGGIGLDSEKKRKIREEAEEAVKKIKHEEGDYRDRVREEREGRRLEGQLYAAQKVAERLDADSTSDNAGHSTGSGAGSGTATDTGKTGKTGDKGKTGLTSRLPVVYRGLVRDREDREREIYARHHLQTSLPTGTQLRLPGYEDDTLEREDYEALGQEEQPAGTRTVNEEVDNEVEDAELDEFNALEVSERLHRVVMYLRDMHWYCFWCKARYDSDSMEGCPGITEEDHD